eukprot:scaffold40129_cov206-Amphora_coffeaeformis.AAC.5
MIQPAIQPWPTDISRLGWLDGTTGTFTTATTSSTSSSSSSTSLGFFGSCHPALNAHRYVGKGGMDAVCREMLQEHAETKRQPRIHVHPATRVARCEYQNGPPLDDDHDDDDSVSNRQSHPKRWKLYGDGLGHEQANAEALQNSSPQQVVLGEFDHLVITDHMAAAMPAWHPCHIQGLEGVVPTVISALRTHLDWDDATRRFQIVQPLFSCMVAWERNMDSTTNSCLHVEYDAATVQGNPILQWVCSQESRPHGETEHDDNLERWILMSTTEFAQQCLGTEGMSQKVSSSQSSTADTGTEASKDEMKVEYIPQTDDYLRSDPAQIMCDEFIKLVTKSHKVKGETHIIPKIVFCKCQRWGAAYTVPSHQQEDYQRLSSLLRSHESSHHITLCGDYLKDVSSEEYVSRVDKETGTYSHAIQDTALSGIQAAKRIASRIKSTTTG